MTDVNQESKKRAFSTLGDIAFKKGDFGNAFDYVKKTTDYDLIVNFGYKCLNEGRSISEQRWGEGSGFELMYAYKAFMLTKDTDGLIKIAERYLSIPDLTSVDLDRAIMALIEVGDKERLINCGDICLKKGYISKGRKAYKAGRVTIPKEKLLECGNVLLDKGWLTDAKSAFRSAKVQIPKERIIDCATVLLHKGYIDSGVCAYIEAGEKIPCKKLIMSANVCLFKRKDWYRAKRGFKLAGEKMPASLLRGYAYYLLKHANLDRAFKIFKSLGEKIPNLLLIKHAENYLSKEDFFSARDVFRILGDRDRLIECGRACYHSKKWDSQIYTAISAFKAAKAKDELVELGKFLQRKGFLLKSGKVYILSTTNKNQIN